MLTEMFLYHIVCTYRAFGSMVSLSVLVPKSVGVVSDIRGEC